MNKTDNLRGLLGTPLKKSLLIIRFAIVLMILLSGGIMEGFSYDNDDLQQRTITGTITGRQTGEPMPGVNILVKGTTQGTISDVNCTSGANV